MSFDNAQIVDLDPSALDTLFGDATASETPEGSETQLKGLDTPNYSTNGIDFYDDSLEAVEDEDTSEVKTETKPVESAEEDTPAEENTEDTPTEEDDKEDEKAPVDKDSVNSILTNTVNYLIEQGLWQDFEGREDLEINEEVYAELAAKQSQHAAYSIVNELIDSTGDYGKAIIGHIKRGGNPDEIIDLFKEQKEIQAIDTTTEQGKQFKIEKYYKEVLKWKPEKVEKTIKRLITDDEIESEFNDINELYDNHYEEKLKEINKQAEEQEQKNKERQAQFVSNIKTALSENEELSDADKRLIASSILDFKHTLDNGQRVNNFYLKFYELQSDPKEYIEMVRYVLDPKGYKERISKKEESKAAKKTFEFIKANSTVTKSASNPIVQKQSPVNKGTGTDFSFRK